MPLPPWSLRMRQVARAAFEILQWIVWIDPKRACCRGHQLCQPNRPFVRLCLRVPAAFLSNQAKKQIFGNLVLPGRVARRALEPATEAFIELWNDLCARSPGNMNLARLQADRVCILLCCTVIQHRGLALEP